jgi:hypothetical protein
MGSTGTMRSRPGERCVFSGRSRISEPMFTTKRWFLSGCYRKAGSGSLRQRLLGLLGHSVPAAPNPSVEGLQLSLQALQPLLHLLHLLLDGLHAIRKGPRIQGIHDELPNKIHDRRFLGDFVPWRRGFRGDTVPWRRPR